VHIVDLIALCAAALVLLVIVSILARQRFMLRAPGAIPVALRLTQRSSRWQYGVARYVAEELRWYRSLGFGTRPTRVVRRGELSVLGRRAPVESERMSLPAHAVIVDCRDPAGELAFAFGEGAYTGFVSWLESAPLS
jgi:hypothetical protein